MAVLSQLIPPIRPNVRMGSAPASDGHGRAGHAAAIIGQQKSDDLGDLGRGDPAAEVRLGHGRAISRACR